MERVFLRSAIQATDSTLTGWSANTAAAIQGAGIWRRLRDPPQEQGAAGVEQDVRQMIAERVQAPQPPFQPQRGQGQWKVIERFAREPNAPKAIGCLDQRIVRQHDVVVPDKPAIKGGLIDGQDSENQEQGQKPGLAVGGEQAGEGIDAGRTGSRRGF